MVVITESPIHPQIQNGFDGLRKGAIEGWGYGSPDKAVSQYVIGEFFELGIIILDGNEFDPYTRRQIARTMCIIIA